MCVTSKVLEIPGPALMPHCGFEDARPRALQCGMHGGFSESLLSLMGVQWPSVRRFWHSSVLEAQPGTIGKLCFE